MIEYSQEHVRLLLTMLEKRFTGCLGFSHEALRLFIRLQFLRPFGCMDPRRPPVADIMKTSHEPAFIARTPIPDIRCSAFPLLRRRPPRVEHDVVAYGENNEWGSAVRFKVDERLIPF